MNETKFQKENAMQYDVLSFMLKGCSYFITKPIEVKLLKTIFDKHYQDLTQKLA